jgi:excisionase family DNA binding protein
VNTDQGYMTSAEVARRLRVSQTTVARWVRDGTMTAVRIGRQYRFRAGDVQAIENNVYAKGAEGHGQTEG